MKRITSKTYWSYRELTQTHIENETISNLTSVRGIYSIWLSSQAQMARRGINAPFSVGEISTSRRPRKDNKSAGLDQIPPEILKIFRNKWINILQNISKETNEQDMISSWEIGIIVYIYKNIHESLLSNFRPIALLNSIYKIFSTISTNRLTPIMNMLTCERQRAYKSNKSTIDVIYNVTEILLRK